MAQRVLITAGASGIGKEIARAFADLSTATPIISGGKKVNSHLAWRRAPANLSAG